MLHIMLQNYKKSSIILMKSPLFLAERGKKMVGPVGTVGGGDDHGGKFLVIDRHDDHGHGLPFESAGGYGSLQAVAVEFADFAVGEMHVAGYAAAYLECPLLIAAADTRRCGRHAKTPVGIFGYLGVFLGHYRASRHLEPEPVIFDRNETYRRTQCRGHSVVLKTFRALLRACA